MVGISATAVWTVVVKRVGALRIEEGGKKTFANVSGALLPISVLYRLFSSSGTVW